MVGGVVRVRRLAAVIDDLACDELESVDDAVVADDAALLADANAAHAARHATLSTTMNGTGVLNVTTDAEGAETLAVALHAAARRARRPGDGLTAGQRRHDALIDIARSYLDSRDDLATISGARPHLQVRVDLTTLARLRPPGLP